MNYFIFELYKIVGLTLYKIKIGFKYNNQNIKELAMKKDLITKMEELLLKDTGEVASEVRTLQKEYQKLWTSEFENARQALLMKADGLKNLNIINKLMT